MGKIAATPQGPERRDVTPRAAHRAADSMSAGRHAVGGFRVEAPELPVAAPPSRPAAPARRGDRRSGRGCRSARSSGFLAPVPRLCRRRAPLDPEERVGAHGDRVDPCFHQEARPRRCAASMALRIGVVTASSSSSKRSAKRSESRSTPSVSCAGEQRLVARELGESMASDRRRRCRHRRAGRRRPERGRRPAPRRPRRGAGPSSSPAPRAAATPWSRPISCRSGSRDPGRGCRAPRDP